MVMFGIKYVLWLGCRNGPTHTRRLKVMLQKNKIKKNLPRRKSSSLTSVFCCRKSSC